MPVAISNLTATWSTSINSVNTAIKMNVADIASAANSKILDLQVDGVSKFVVYKSGNTVANGVIVANSFVTSGGINLLSAIETGGDVSAPFFQANQAFYQANQAFAKANTANITADLAFNKANAANLLAFNSAAGANAWVNTVYGFSNTFTHTIGGAAFYQANQAFYAANTSGTTAIGPAFFQANQAFAKANTANITADLAFDKANAANILAFNSAAGANAWVNTVYGFSNTFTHTIGGSAFGQANLAFAKANAANVLAFNALPNTSGVSFNGDLNFYSGKVNVGSGLAIAPVRLQVNATAGSAIPVRISGATSGNNTQMRFYGNGAQKDLFAIGTDIAAGDGSVAFDIFDLIFSQNRFRIDSTGNVGIGTTSPTSKLHVIGTANVTSTFTLGTLNVADAIGSSYDKANAANVLAYNSAAGANAWVNTVYGFTNSAIHIIAGAGAFNQANQAFNKANTANITADLAFDKANAANLLAFNSAAGANAWVNTVYGFSNTFTHTIGGASFFQANQAFNKANTANITADLAFNKANAANVLAFNSAAGANAWVNTVFGLSNSYAQTVGAASNLLVGAAFYQANLAYAQANTSSPQTVADAFFQANQAFAKANAGNSLAFTAVQNTATITFIGTANNSSYAYGKQENQLSVSSAAILTTSRLIGDTSFNGSADIVPARITYKDTRSLDFPPITSANTGIGLHLKLNTTDGLNDGGTYHGVLHLQQWGDTSGGLPHQLGFTDNGTVYLRTAINATAWGTWREIWHDANDGTGSGLDADLLDGQHGTYYSTATSTGDAFFQANQAFAKANAGNLLAFNSAAATNAWTNTVYGFSNSFTHTIGGAAYDKANAANVLAFNALPKSGGTITGGLNVQSDFTHTGGTFYINNMSGAGGTDEGGEIRLANATSNSILSGTISIDIYQNKLRFFETNSPNRGAYINLASAIAGVGTDLLSSTSATDSLARSWAGGAYDKANAANVLAFNALPNTNGAVFNGTLTATTNLSADKIISTNNGNGENYKVGDDAWLGDTNLANAVRLKGQQNASIGYIMFGPNDGKLLGRAGTDNLTYDGNIVWHAGTDGAGSGLDADLLDNQHGSYYATATSTGDAFFQANQAFAKANAGNLLAFNSAAGANAWVNTVYGLSNSYTQTVGTAGNNYSITIGSSSNAWVNTVYGFSNSFTHTIGGAGAFNQANQAFAKANAANVLAYNALANTAGITTAGSLYVPSALYVRGPNTIIGLIEYANTLIITPNSGNWNTSIRLQSMLTTGDQDTIRFLANGKQLLFLDDTGYVGVGASFTPTANLHVLGNAIISTTLTLGSISDVAGTIGNSFDKANAANVLAFNSAGGANAWTNTVYGFSNSYTQTVGTAGNNYSITIGASSNAWTNTVYGFTNTYTRTVGASSNAWTNTVYGFSNSYTQTVGTAGNNYSITIGASSNAWTNTVYGFSNTFTHTIGGAGAFFQANQAFARANTANANFTAANILSNLITVDGTGSLLDADTLDGWHQSELGGKQLASASVGTGTTVDYSWVSAGTINWSGPAPVYLSAVLRGLSHGAATSQPLRIEFSDDKGVTFTTAINISPPIAASTALNGHVLIYRPSATTATKVIVWNTSPQDRSSSNVGTWELPAAGGTAALSNIRFGFASGNFDAGAVYVYGFS